MKLLISRPLGVLEQSPCYSTISVVCTKMWCTRWYLPLVLLPFPVAQPFFLLLFLFSTTMHARPCFYCIVLLSAMFMSSCYWPPVPIDAPLASPWSENVTTFGEALHFMIPNLPEEMTPDNIPILDRCWCDFSARAFFKPFNTTQWEVDSLVRVKEELERRLEDDAKDKQLDASAHVDETGAMAVTNHADDASPARRENIWDRVWSFTQRTDTSSNAPSAPVKASAGGPALEANLTSPPGEASGLTPQPDTSLPLPDKRPLFRLEYDLRPYGLSMVVDFGWSTVTS